MDAASWVGFDRHGLRWLEDFNEDEVVPPTPDTIDNESVPGESALERCLTAVHGEPLLKFLGPEDLLEFGAVSKETIQAVQDHLAFCEPEHYWRFFDMLKHFLQTTLVVGIRNKYFESFNNSGEPPPSSGLAVFLTRCYVIGYVTGDLRKHNSGGQPLNFMSPRAFCQSEDADFAEYLRETYSRPLELAVSRDRNKVHRKWELPYKDNNAMFSRFAAFMESQLVHVSEEAARVRVAWWYNRRMRFVWAFMHQPMCGLCGDSNSPITRSICGTCERVDCRGPKYVIVCRACHEHKREEFERAREERRAAQRLLEENRRFLREMEATRRAVEERDRRHRESKRQRRNAPRDRTEGEEDEEEEPLLVGSAAEEPVVAQYECSLGNHACQQYGHEGQECICPCHDS